MADNFTTYTRQFQLVQWVQLESNIVTVYMFHDSIRVQRKSALRNELGKGEEELRNSSVSFSHLSAIDSSGKKSQTSGIALVTNTRRKD